ncbi:MULTISPECIES: hypothetical protein [Paenibacillus]|uniref:hypothetical protein n=1 Tax=Paenibacillus TaxID=44249 RepID=UPI002FE3B563
MNRLAMRTVMLLLTIIFSLGVSGCMKSEAQTNRNRDPEAIKERMLSHLQQKYGEEFVPVSLTLSGFAYNYDNLSAYPKQGTQSDAFEVWGTQMKDGSYRISDGYFGKYIRPEYEAAMSGLIEEMYSTFKLYTNFGEGVLPDRLNKETKIEEIYAPGETVSSDTVVFVKQEAVRNPADVEASLVELAKKMREKKLVGFVQLFVVRNDKYENIDLQALNAADDSEYFVGDYKSVMVTPELKIRQNGREVDVDG